jgi:hypothetical protein
MFEAAYYQAFWLASQLELEVSGTDKKFRAEDLIGATIGDIT